MMILEILIFNCMFEFSAMILLIWKFVEIWIKIFFMKRYFIVVKSKVVKNYYVPLHTEKFNGYSHELVKDALQL